MRHKDAAQGDDRGSRGGGQRRVQKGARGDGLPEQDLGEVVQRDRVRVQGEPVGAHQGGCHQCRDGQHQRAKDQQGQPGLRPAAQTAQPDMQGRLRWADQRAAGVPQQQHLQQDHHHRQQGQNRGDHRHVGQHRGAKAGQTLPDQHGQGDVARGNAQQRLDAEVPQGRDKGQRITGNQGGGQKGQDDASQQPAAPGPCDAGGIAHLTRQGTQGRQHDQKDQRRVLNAQQKDQPAGGIERMRRAQFRRDPHAAQDRRGWAHRLYPGNRRHMRRDHHRDQQQEGEDTLPADIGQTDGQRDPRARDQRQKRREKGAFQRMRKGAPDRA